MRFFIIFLLLLYSCVPSVQVRKVNRNVPSTYDGIADSVNSAEMPWRFFFKDPHLVALIDTALQNNQELNIVLTEIEIARNEVRERKAEYLPFLHFAPGVGAEKPGEYTREGAVEHSLEIAPGQPFPEPLSDFFIGVQFSWEIDIWKKLRNARKAALYRYLATIEGKNFLVTQLVAEVAKTYYELMALKNKITVINRMITLQQNALNIIKVQKRAARATELAVKRFEAEVAKNKARLYLLQQQIIETENRLNFLLGRYPQPIAQDYEHFMELEWDSVHIGAPWELLRNRPDVRRAEQQLQAAKLEVKSARAAFYPTLGLFATLATQAFAPLYLIEFPASLAYGFALESLTPLLNRNALKARYFMAAAKQQRAVIQYEQTLLKAYIEVFNQWKRIQNIRNSYLQKQQQVNALNRSVRVVINLFRYARADYLEVLLAQREALEAQIDLIELKLAETQAVVDLYRALGGGWQ